MKNRKATIAICVTLILAVFIAIFIILHRENDVATIQNNKEEILNVVDEIQIADLTPEDEQATEVQEANLENQTFEELGEIAYNGSDKTPDVTLGTYKGLTYYSQADSRWASQKYGNNTMINSGCGPTSAAMIVSSIKGEILPPTMADLFVKYGYRSANSGTYWAAMKWTADAFDIDMQETSNTDTMISLLKEGNYVIAICKNGLFTYGGHFIVLIGINDDIISVYDPYLYSGKFLTATRKGANAKIVGNTVQVSVESFKKYANAQNYYCYLNNRKDTKINETKIVQSSSAAKSITNVNYSVKVTASSGLNIRRGASTNYAKVGSYKKGTIVQITATSGNWGKTSSGWICLSYTTEVTSTTKSTTSTSTSTKQVIAKSGLVLRKTANGTKILTIPYGKRVTVLSLNYTTKGGLVWSKVKYNGKTGYVAKKYLK